MSLEVPYSHCYCEENIFVCLEMLRQYTDIFDCCYAVVMSSFACDPSGEVHNQWSSVVPYRSFKKVTLKDDLLIWDYHVVGVVRCKLTAKWFVIDRDSALPHSEDPTLGAWRAYCIDFAAYCSQTLFLDRLAAEPAAQRLQVVMDAVRYRIVSSDTFLCFFRSDRSHMLNEAGEFNMTPPPWPPFTDFPEWANSSQRGEVQEALDSLNPTFRRNNITSLVNMGNFKVPGVVVDRYSFRAFFGGDITGQNLCVTPQLQ